MRESTYIVIFVTTANTDEAQRISEALLNQRKAACINIVPKVSSLFWWEDRLDSAQESLLIIKTRASQTDDIVKLVKELHSYDIPEIIAMPIVGGNQDYLDWISKEVK